MFQAPLDNYLKAANGCFRHRNASFPKRRHMHTSSATSRSNTWWGQAFQNHFIALVLAMVVIVPLFASPADSHLSGVAVLAFEAFALLLAVTLLWRAQWNVGREQIKTFLTTGANAPVLLLLALAVVSCAFAPNKIFAVQETVKLAAGVLLYFVVAYQFRQSKHLLMLVDTLIFLAIAVSFLTMAQYTLGDTVLGGERGTMLFGNQQPLGSLLMILLPIVAVVALTEAQLSRRQLAAQAASVMTVGGLLLAHTRSGWLGAFAGMVVLGVLVAYSAQARKARAERKAASNGLAMQKHKFVLPLMLVIVTMGFVATLNLQNSGIFERAATVTQTATDQSWQGRLHAWSGIVRMIEARPLTGWGVGQFPLYQHDFTGVGASTNALTTFAARGSLAEQAHNYYLQTAADLGLPGLLLFLSILGAFFYQGVRRIGKMDAGIRRTLLIGSIGAVVAFSVDAMSSPSWQFGQVSMFLWLILGAGASCIQPRTRQAEAPVYSAAPRFVRPLAVVAATLLFTLVVMPSAAFAAAFSGDYNDGHDDTSVGKIALIVSGIGLATYFLFGADRRSDNSVDNTID
jgi:putative inorganic carbon (HCO3(-)) transporter